MAPEVGKGLGRRGVLLKIGAEVLFGAGQVAGLHGLLTAVQQVLRGSGEEGGENHGGGREFGKASHFRPVYKVTGRR